MPAARNRMLGPCTLTGQLRQPRHHTRPGVAALARAGDRVLIGDTGASTTCYSGRSAFNGYPAPAVRIKGRAA
jgi:hypothetical protein